MCSCRSWEKRWGSLWLDSIHPMPCAMMRALGGKMGEGVEHIEELGVAFDDGVDDEGGFMGVFVHEITG